VTTWRENPDIGVLSGDLNKSALAHIFGAEFPDMFFDVGESERPVLSAADGPGGMTHTRVHETLRVSGPVVAVYALSAGDTLPAESVPPAAALPRFGLTPDDIAHKGRN
jgi:hypothetical protein